MRTIFERLVEELRAWHLFEDRKEYPLRWELPGESPDEYGRGPRRRRAAAEWTAVQGRR